MKKVVFWQRLLMLVIIGIVVFVTWSLEIGCLFKSIFKNPCLTCGMTRSFFAFINGDFAASWQYHPMLLSVPVLILMFLFGDKLFKGKTRAPAIILLAVILLGFIINYVYNMVTYSF